MSAAQVTEAHLRLANQLVSSPPSPLVLATLIADSEARACAELRADRDYNHECINRLASATGTLGEKSERVVEVALSTIARAERAEAELAIERQKVRALTAILESICGEWGRNHDANPIGAGQRMETMASKMLEDMEEAE